MAVEALRLVPYALVAALSPTAFAATLAVIASGRLKALGFAIGFVAGQVLAMAVLLRLGSATIPHRDSNHPTLQATLGLVLAVVLLWLAARVRRGRPIVEVKGQSERTKKVLDRLDRMRVVTAVAAGVLLGIGGKRLVLSALAAGSIAAAGLGTGAGDALVGWYSLLATSVVWVPVLVFVFFGQRAAAWLANIQARLVKHQREALYYVLLAAALILAVNAVVTLI
ncbi:MAG TPA: GAP family protein [Gaiellaceae bacterium]|nr:GAP family protein [Gaiellaceae bacterium]